MTFGDTIRRTIHIESEDDIEELFEDYGGVASFVDIGDTVTVCEEADVFLREDKTGWAIYWKCNYLDGVRASDEDDKETYVKKYRQAKKLFEDICNKALSGELDKSLDEHDSYEPSFDHSNPSEVFKQFGESQRLEDIFASILRESETNLQRGN